MDLSQRPRSQFKEKNEPIRRHFSVVLLVRRVSSRPQPIRGRFCTMTSSWPSQPMAVRKSLRLEKKGAVMTSSKSGKRRRRKNWYSNSYSWNKKWKRVGFGPRWLIADRSDVSCGAQRGANREHPSPATVSRPAAENRPRPTTKKTQSIKKSKYREKKSITNQETIVQKNPFPISPYIERKVMGMFLGYVEIHLA